MLQAQKEGQEHEEHRLCCPSDGCGGVSCQLLAVSKHSVAPSITSCFHGLQVDGPAGTALQAGQQDSCSGIWADLCSLCLVILPIIMERLEKLTFMQVSACFSCQWVAHIYC